VQISIKTNFPDVQRSLAALRKEISGPASVRALNRTVEQARTSMSREIRSEFNMSPTEVNAALKVRRASRSQGQFSLSAELSSSNRRGRSLNLVRFMQRTVTLAAYRKRIKAGEGNTGRGNKALELRFKIKKAGPAVGVKGAFIGNKGRTVFIRTGKSRLPIKAVQTIDVAQMFNTQRINRRVVEFINRTYPKNVASEIKFYTERFNRCGKA